MNLDSLVEMFLTEAKEQLSVNEIIEKAKAKQLGVKIEGRVLEGLNDKIFILTKLYNKVVAAKADPLVAFKFLLGHLRNIDDLKDAVSSDAVIQYALNSKKDWFRKEIGEDGSSTFDDYSVYVDNTAKWSDIEDEPFKKLYWKAWSEAIKPEATRHGKASKMHNGGSGIAPLYKDDTWELYSPKSFEEEKQIAFYGENWDKPTHWCTRANVSWYKNYSTSRGEKLWIIRNKNGHTWQLALNPENYHIEFMDEQDDRPEDTTTLSVSFPEEIKNKIHDRNGYTLSEILKGKRNSTSKKKQERKSNKI